VSPKKTINGDEIEYVPLRTALWNFVKALASLAWSLGLAIVFVVAIAVAIAALAYYSR
jgi:hypothetical protein